MKPVPAIVEQAIDIDLIAEQIIVAMQGQSSAESTILNLEGRLESARGAAAARRLEIGRLLSRVRGAWPPTGPKAKGWSAFLARVKLDDSTAARYMAEYRDPAGSAQARAKPAADVDPDDDTGARPPAPRGSGEPPPFRQLDETEIIQLLARLAPDVRKRVLAADRANVKGGSGDAARGTWCTSKDWAAAVGPWELDPFSNPRSKIASARRCMLEDGGDAFGGGEPGATPGLYLTGRSHGLTPVSAVADSDTRVWIQPPYELVAEAIAHYGHTRFCALLRWSPDVKAWFPALWARTAVVCHPFGERMEFEPPPGVESSGDMPFPHALYYASEGDVTDEVRARCLVWRVDHTLDCAATAPEPALHLVK